MRRRAKQGADRIAEERVSEIVAAGLDATFHITLVFAVKTRFT
jgi:hypothetical protein